MSDTKELLERAWRQAPQPDKVMDSLIRRRARKERSRKIAGAVIGITIAIVIVASLIQTLKQAERPADEPTPRPQGIFSKVGGWITYGNREGIWAVDPAHPGDRESQIQLSSVPGIPLAWSSDGSELLISREYWVVLSRRQLRRGQELPASQRGLFVLHADGTETHLIREEVSGASFSPDGRTVVFAPSLELEQTHLDPGLYLIDADGGGVATEIVASSRRYLPGQGRSFRTDVYFPTFSPDGTQIAYFDGFGDNSHSLRVVNADGGDLRVLIDNIEAYRITNLAWSPDGSRLAFGRRANDGVYTIGVDGSGLRLVIPDGVNPYWSPDGSLISFSYDSFNDAGRRGLLIADRNGRVVQNFGYGASGPWNPLTQLAPDDRELTATERGSGAAPLAYAIAVLGAVGVLVIAWRARRMAAAT